MLRSGCGESEIKCDSEGGERTRTAAAVCGRDGKARCCGGPISRAAVGVAIRVVIAAGYKLLSRLQIPRLLQIMQQSPAPREPPDLLLGNCRPAARGDAPANPSAGSDGRQPFSRNAREGHGWERTLSTKNLGIDGTKAITDIVWHSRMLSGRSTKCRMALRRQEQLMPFSATNGTN